jgi:uncharacterized protein (DUF2267 family)
VESSFKAMVGYQPDIKNAKQILSAYNRHNDSYSVYDLRPEIILVSAFISHLLQSTDFGDEYSTKQCSEQLFKLMALKTKMIDSMHKIQDLEYRHKHLDFEREMKAMKLNSIPMEDFKAAIKDVCQIVTEEVSGDKVNSVITKLSSVISGLEIKA